ncbi:MAG: DUF362 domain-containing protein, partial [Deltaproteobacteria bacterium]|nr:DUF362 domain-containing protein [Deltaproteobacteria bacterium]
MSKVYFTPSGDAREVGQDAGVIEALWNEARLGACFGEKDLAALKLHVGEPGKTTQVRPAAAAALVRLMRSCGARPFLTDTAVLYRSARDNGVGHARVAHDNGFTLEAVGAPFIPADGLRGSQEMEIEVGGRHFAAAAIATAIVEARSMLVLSHATGHLGTGFGGALKNLGMGCCSKKGKLRQHHGHEPSIDPDACTACSTCAEWCPEGAITVEAHAAIDSSACIGCGECIASCLEGAVTFDWGIMGVQLGERIVEHAAAVVRGKPGRIAYVTVAEKITKDCDCIAGAQEPIMPDVGVLASLDPVAIDQAVHDLIVVRAGRTIEDMSYPSRDGTVQMR